MPALGILLSLAAILDFIRNPWSRAEASLTFLLEEQRRPQRQWSSALYPGKPQGFLNIEPRSIPSRKPPSAIHSKPPTCIIRVQVQRESNTTRLHTQKRAMTVTSGFVRLRSAQFIATSMMWGLEWDTKCHESCRSWKGVLLAVFRLRLQPQSTQMHES